MLTATVTFRVDAFGEPCNERVTYAVPDAGGYVRLDNCAGSQVYDPWYDNGSTLMWTPRKDDQEPEESFLAFIRKMRRQWRRRERALFA